MIIDVHTHLGWDFTCERNFPEETLVNKMTEYGIDIQIVQPGTTHNLTNAISQHNAIARLCREYPGRFYGMAHPNPYLDATVYQDEVARCVEDLKFIAIKLQPYTTAINPGSKTGRKAFDCARKYNIPVMVHTGAGFPYSAPVNLIRIAMDYPDVKIIMAHCGTMLLSNEATAVFSLCPNVYGDTSWSAGHHIKNWVRDFGPRMMFASDLGENTGAELAKIRTYGLTDVEQKCILSKTAFEVFNLMGKVI